MAKRKSFWATIKPTRCSPAIIALLTLFRKTFNHYIMNRSLVALIALTSFSVSTFAANFDWPQWRGPNRDDVSKETGLLKSWPEGGPQKVWSYENAGNGYSGPAIVSGKLFTL